MYVLSLIYELLQASMHALFLLGNGPLVCDMHIIYTSLEVLFSLNV